MGPTRLLSKAATQLLRWGRADVVGPAGLVRSVVLAGWAPATGKFVSSHGISQLAELLDVDDQWLADALVSEGRHGPRAELVGTIARAMWSPDLYD